MGDRNVGFGLVSRSFTSNSKGPPAASSGEVARRMRSVRQRDTSCEMAVRRIVHGRGLRYRVDHALPFNRRRRADLLFSRQKVAVFIDGCFWHGCPQHGTSAKSNAEWWRRKIESNRARDADTVRRLEGLGWLTLRFWEHEDPVSVADRVQVAVNLRRCH